MKKKKNRKITRKRQVHFHSKVKWTHTQTHIKLLRILDSPRTINHSNSIHFDMEKYNYNLAFALHFLLVFYKKALNVLYAKPLIRYKAIKEQKN